jgi:hypothetical protein
MKIRVIKTFKDKAFDNKIVRQEGDIIECDDELAMSRIKGGFAEEYKEVVKEKPFKKENKGKKEKEDK